MKFNLEVLKTYNVETIKDSRNECKRRSSGYHMQTKTCLGKHVKKWFRKHKNGRITLWSLGQRLMLIAFYSSWWSMLATKCFQYVLVHVKLQIQAKLQQLAICILKYNTGIYNNTEEHCHNFDNVHINE